MRPFDPTESINRAIARLAAVLASVTENYFAKVVIQLMQILGDGGERQRQERIILPRIFVLLKYT